MAIVCIGSFFLNMQVVLEKILQATGNMIGPMVCSLTGAVVNIILDPILIFGLLGAPKLGVAGAAIATVIGQVCGMTMGAFITFKGDHLVKLTVKGFKIDWKIAADIYKVGLPSIVMQSIASVMIIFYNKILVDFSTTAVAVLGVYFKIQSFVFMPVFGLNQGAMPIMGYNYGAKDKSRLMQAYKEALKIAVIVMALGVVLFQLFPKELLLMFEASDEMLRHRSSGPENYQYLFPAGGVRHHNRNTLSGDGTRHVQLVRFRNQTACGNSSAGVYLNPNRRRYAFLGIIPTCGNPRSNLQRNHAETPL